VNIGSDTDTILTIPKWHLLIHSIELVFSKNDKDENKSLYIQTFIFVLMIFSLYINDLRTIHLDLVSIRLTFEH